MKQEAPSSNNPTNVKEGSFTVKSEHYHDIATLLYEGIFDVKVPEKGIAFRGAIQEYYTSMTNLYKKGEVGDYHVSLLEVKNKERGMS
ncbi:DUF3219 family protein [Lederbergia ruris]|uniref:DUF3219 family protein n=1 Tax=Lederbergia ruris TaxID=217495 RepID=UPI001BB4036A